MQFKSHGQFADMQKAFLEYDKDRSVPYLSRRHSAFSLECSVLRRSCWPALRGALGSDIADAVHTSLLLCVAPCCTALHRTALRCSVLFCICSVLFWLQRVVLVAGHT